MTDPRGLVQKTDYDLPGRSVRAVAAFANNPSFTNNWDQATEYAYDGDNHVQLLTAYPGDGTLQQTRYSYAANPADPSWVSSNDQLTLVQYPDKTSGRPSTQPADQETYLCDNLGVAFWSITKMTRFTRTVPVPQDPSFFEVVYPDVWGDFGPILMGGIPGDRDEHGTFVLKRTGPFVPPISLAVGRDLVVTDAFRRVLEGSPLAGLSFRPVVKRHIVEFHWEQWDRSGEMGEVPADLNEPEDIILEYPHAAQVAQAIGPLWEAWAEPLVDVEIVNERSVWPMPTKYDLLIVGPPPAGLDFFRSKNHNWVFASARAKKWLEQQAPGWLRFLPVISGSDPR